MRDLNRRPAGVRGYELNKSCARIFFGNCCTLGPTLVVPMRTLFDEYSAWCKRNDIKPDSSAFRAVLDEAHWATIVERPEARGRLKAIVQGVGVRPTAPNPDPLA
jgi:hypothetical protein